MTPELLYHLYMATQIEHEKRTGHEYPSQHEMTCGVCFSLVRVARGLAGKVDLPRLAISPRPPADGAA